jgi:outer membrane protein assembly complex protein YaeT
MIVFLLLLAASTEFKIGLIEIHDNEYFSDKEIKQIMLTKTPALLRSGTFKQEIFTGDITAITNLYKYSGFLDVEVTYDLAFDSMTGTVAIDISVTENNQTFVRDITFKGNTLFNDAALLTAVTTIPGEPFDQQKMDFDNYVLTSLYDDQGYADATVLSSQQVKDNSARITHDITEGEKQFVHSIEIMGLARTRRSSLLREIIMKPGDVFRYAMLLQSQRNLYNLGIFKTIRVDARNAPVSNQKIVQFTLTENDAIHADLRLGYGTRDRVRLGAGIAHNNLFGRVWRAQVDGKLSFIEYRISTRLTFPRFFILPVRHSIGAFFQVREEIGFTTRTIGAQYKVHFMVLNGDFSTQYEIERTHTSYTDTTSGTDTWVHGVSFNWVKDTRNDPLATRRGEYLILALETSGIVLPADVHYVRPTAEYRIFRPVSFLVAGISMKTGIAEPVSPSIDIPVHKRFYCGGTTSVRGYGEWMIGPTNEDGDPTGGKVLYEGSAELRIPLYRILGAAVFLDWGNVWQTYDDVDASVRWGAGAGIRIKTPLGSIRLDYGWKIAPREEETAGAWHFAIGEAF